jgi:hypothetical protein
MWEGWLQEKDDRSLCVSGRYVSDNTVGTYFELGAVLAHMVSGALVLRFL